jgi:hypothetical protein
MILTSVSGSGSFPPFSNKTEAKKAKRRLIMKRRGHGLSALLCLVGVFLVLPLGGPAYGQDFMYKEFDGVMLFYTPKDMTAYRELLPALFDLPENPLVEVFVIDYYKMAPWALEPYREAAVFLLAKYKGEETWHCITMPVTSEKARIGGIRNLGYPKVLAEVIFDRKQPVFSGSLKNNGKSIMELTLDTKGQAVGPKEREWFKRLTGIPSLNIREGKLVDPMPGSRNARTSILDLSARYPEIFEVRVGRATLAGHPEAAPNDNGWRPKAFGIEVKEIVLAYYFQNKYGLSFGRPKVISE